MRRPLVAILLAAALTTAAAACAHPQNIAPKPGESTTTTRANTPTTTSMSSGADETAQVCRQATSISNDSVDQLTGKLEEAQSAASSGNNAAALAAASEARRIATNWKSELENLARRPVRANVRTTLEDGIDTIDRILTTNPQNLDAREAERDVREFLTDLERVCA